MDNKERIFSSIQEISHAVEEEDMAAAKNLLNKLNILLDEGLYNELGKITRDLHDVLKESEVTKANELPALKDKLDYISKLTEEAANKTMDVVESTIPVSDDLSNNSKKLLSELEKSNDKEHELYKDTIEFLKTVDNSSSTINTNLQNILLAQNYQDLTGQAIKKVMSTVSSVESRLFEIMKLVADDNVQANANSKPKEKIMQNQDEVDDLLSSLGF